MNRYKKISLASLFILLAIATLANMTGVVAALGYPGYPPPNQFLNPILLGSLTAALILIIGAFKLSNLIVGSKNKKDRFVLFFFLSVMLISIIIWIVYSIWFSATIVTM
jgi:hypothetical protein